MTALYPELSEEALAVKIKWFKKILEILLKLQSHIAYLETGPVSGNVLSPVSHPQHSSSARGHTVQLFLQIYLYCLYRCHLYLLLRHFLLQGRTGQLGKI